MGRLVSSKVLFAANCALLVALCAPAIAAKGGEKPAAPSLACAGATGLSITLEVCAGRSGTPKGFSIQWATNGSFVVGPDGLLGTADDYTWPDAGTPDLCTASYVGRARPSRGVLAPNHCVTVDIGERLAGSGASTNCPGALACGSSYVFRAVVPGAAAPVGIAVSSNAFCNTLRCLPSVTGCTVTAAYWKDHGPLPNRTNAENEWGVTSLTLGNVTYTDLELQAILDTPAEGNGLIALAHQLIAAKLNIANGASDAEIAATVVAADSIIRDLVVPPGGSGFLSLDATWELTETLTDYNEGAIGPGHCD
jgi:hypothetical protein